MYSRLLHQHDNENNVLSQRLARRHFKLLLYRLRGIIFEIVLCSSGSFGVDVGERSTVEVDAWNMNKEAKALTMLLINIAILVSETKLAFRQLFAYHFVN